MSHGPITDFLNPAVTDPGATMGRTGPDDEIYAGRVTLLWTPSDEFDANFKLMVNSQERNAGNASSEPFCINGQTQPVLLGTTPLPGADCEKEPGQVPWRRCARICRELPLCATAACRISTPSSRLRR